MNHRLSLAAVSLLLATSCSPSTARVITQRSGNARTGALLDEAHLSPAAVQRGMARLYERTVDGQFYAQPLYATNVAGHPEVVFVATEHNSVFAFDAANPSAGAPLWQVNLGPSAPAPNPDFGTRYGDFVVLGPEVGITSTPVLVDDVLYVDAFLNPAPHLYQHVLFALDARDGHTLLSTEIAAQVPGDGVGSIDGTIAFDPKQHLQRSALLYEHGLVYLAFASYADTNPYHGWILAYDARTLEQRVAFCVTPDAAPEDGDDEGEGGVWQASAGPAADANGNVYVAAGNGSFNANAGGHNYGNSLIELAPASDRVVDWFTPFDQAALALQDLDFGSVGTILDPASNLAIAGGKNAKLYVVDRTHLGGIGATDDSQIVQTIDLGAISLFSTPVLYRGAARPYLYAWPNTAPLSVFALDGGQFTRIAQSALVTNTKGSFDTTLALSANGAHDAVLWALHPVSTDGMGGPAILRAFDADDLPSGTVKELWNSDQQPGQSVGGSFVKFTSPLIGGGKVFVPTLDGKLVVYAATAG